jgi:hypothetical protein
MQSCNLISCHLKEIPTRNVLPGDALLAVKPATKTAGDKRFY